METSLNTIEPYSLYQTFNCKLPKTDMTIEQKEKLVHYSNSLYSHQKIAFVRLIVEHSRLNNLFSHTNAPYGLIIEEGDSSLTFDLENFPIELRWILWKFFEMCGEV